MSIRSSTHLPIINKHTQSDRESDLENDHTSLPKRQKCYNHPESPYDGWFYAYDYGLLYKPMHQLQHRLTTLAKDQKTLPEEYLPKIASFDMDDTLINPKNGRTFPIDENDFVLKPNVAAKLQLLYKHNFEIIIISNQSNCEDDLEYAKTIIKKVEKISAIIDIPISCYISTKKDSFRKPSRGMWDAILDAYYILLQQQYPQCTDFKTVIQTAYSFYVGDAAGRAGKTRAMALKQNPPAFIKDHASTDLEFTLNVFGKNNIAQHFFVPEVFFHDSERNNDIPQNQQNVASLPAHMLQTSWSTNATEPLQLLREFCGDHVTSSSDSPTTAAIFEKSVIDSPFYQTIMKTPTNAHCIILVAPPACGKSTFSNNFIKFMAKQAPNMSWVRVNQDTLGTVPKCLETMKKSLQSGVCTIIDNTNSTPDIRSKFIAICKELGIEVHCVYFHNVTKDLVLHLNQVRTASICTHGVVNIGPVPAATHFKENAGASKKKATNTKKQLQISSTQTHIPASDPNTFVRVPTIAINMYFSRLQAPTKQEGFTSLTLFDWKSSVPILLLDLLLRPDVNSHSTVYVPPHGVHDRTNDDDENSKVFNRMDHWPSIEWSRNPRHQAPVTSRRTFIDYFLQHYSKK